MLRTLFAGLRRPSPPPSIVLPPPPATHAQDSQRIERLLYLEKETDEYLQMELEILALQDEIATNKRLIKRYRTLMLLPIEDCDDVERGARLSHAYHSSIVSTWRSIAHTRDRITRLEAAQQRLVLLPAFEQPK